MRSHLLGEYREAEEAAPPPQRMGASGSWDCGGTHRESYPCSSLENPASQPPPNPSPGGSYLSPALRAPLPAASATRSHPQPRRPRPSTAGQGHWHSPGPIVTSLPRPRHQCARAGGGASPMSFRLLPGPQDPFCLGRARPGLSSRHFLEEAPSSGLGSGVGSRPSRLRFCNFPPCGRLLGSTVASVSCFAPLVWEAWEWRALGAQIDWDMNISFYKC